MISTSSEVVPATKAGRIALNLQKPEHQYDLELVQRFNGGDATAFIEIVSRHREKVYQIAMSLIHNHSDAEEITQDTFIRAHRGLATFRGDAALVTWLHRIAINLSRNRYWYFFRRRRHLSMSIDAPFSEDNATTLSEVLPSEQPDPADDMANEEFGRLVQRCMDHLPSRHREILILRNVRYLSYEEIAVVLGINAGTVKSRIARARESLKAFLKESCPEFSRSNVDITRDLIAK